MSFPPSVLACGVCLSHFSVSSYYWLKRPHYHVVRCSMYILNSGQLGLKTPSPTELPNALEVINGVCLKLIQIKIEIPLPQGIRCARVIIHFSLEYTVFAQISCYLILDTLWKKSISNRHCLGSTRDCILAAA